MDKIELDIILNKLNLFFDKNYNCGLTSDEYVYILLMIEKKKNISYDDWMGFFILEIIRRRGGMINLLELLKVSINNYFKEEYNRELTTTEIATITFIYNPVDTTFNYFEWKQILINEAEFAGINE